jgi:dTDP-4-dehydrorhamnose 3,5-epimerase
MGSSSQQVDGVTVTPLKVISDQKGKILHGLKKSDPEFNQFGEAYFSTIFPEAVKGWKQHQQMTLNLLVPIGKIRVVIFDDRPGSRTYGLFQEVLLCPENHHRLTIAPGLWVAFQGIGQGENLLLNIADLEHDPKEALNKELDEIPFSWSSPQLL